MKLVIATPLYPPEIGGPATYAKALEEGLPERGIEVELVKFSEVRHLPKLLRHLAYYRRVRRAARSADAVLALDPVSVGLPTCLAARRAHKPLIVKIVGDYAWEQGRQRFGITDDLDAFVLKKNVPVAVNVLRKVQVGVARRAKEVIVPSEYLKRIVTAWGLSEERITVIYNAVPLEAPGTVPESAMRLPRPLVVSVGRLVPWKRVGGVIDAVSALPQGALAVVGEGPERAALERRAQEKLPGRHAFLGAISHADTLAVIASADAFVLNSSYEGLSHVLIEALALGAPIVATDAGGNGEVITNDETGLLVPVAEQGALEEVLARLLNDTELRARLSARAKESAARFSHERMLELTATFFKSRLHDD